VSVWIEPSLQALYGIAQLLLWDVLPPLGRYWATAQSPSEACRVGETIQPAVTGGFFAADR
jgi:hypothetical protein